MTSHAEFRAYWLAAVMLLFAHVHANEIKLRPGSSSDYRKLERREAPMEEDQSWRNGIPEGDREQLANRLVAVCKNESNYAGEFQDRNEATIELKCFYACTLKKLNVVSTDSTLNLPLVNKLLAESISDNALMLERYKLAATTCNAEVSKNDDRCEYAFNIIDCIIRKVTVPMGARNVA